MNFSSINPYIDILTEVIMAAVPPSCCDNEVLWMSESQDERRTFKDTEERTVTLREKERGREGRRERGVRGGKGTSQAVRRAVMRHQTKEKREGGKKEGEREGAELECGGGLPL